MNGELKDFLAKSFDEYSSNNDNIKELFLFLQELRRLSPYLLAAYLDIATTIIREPAGDSPTMQRAEKLISLRYFDRMVAIMSAGLADACDIGLISTDEDSEEIDIWTVVEDNNFYVFVNEYVRHRSFSLQDQSDNDNIF